MFKGLGVKVGWVLWIRGLRLLASGFRVWGLGLGICLDLTSRLISFDALLGFGQSLLRS